MTPVDAARARITDTLFMTNVVLAKAEAEQRKSAWYSQEAVISPDLMIRVCREALAVLDRHQQSEWDLCEWCGADGPTCSEVESVVRAWAP